MQDVRIGAPHSAGEHISLAEREVAEIADVPKSTATRRIERAAIVGAGTMGGGIAMNFANAGIPVTIVDTTREALDRGLGAIARNYARSARKGKLGQDAMDARMKRIAGSLDYADIGEADIVIEAVFEGMELKKAVFRNLDAVCKPGAVLATNTSTLDIDAIAAATTRPDDIIGLHFFSPANVMKLLEIVRCARTSKEVIATSLDLAKRIGKVGVLVGNCFGFVGNRMLEPYLRQAQFMVEEGASPERIDKAMSDFGFAMGPFAMSDLAGNDVGWRIRQEMATTAADGPDAATIADRLCEAGRYGQKTGAGWYQYDPGDRTPRPDPEVAGIIARVRADKGIAPRAISDEEIVKRCVYALVNEGCRVLEDGKAQRAGDIDVIYVSGYGFPRSHGGPMFYAETTGLREVHDEIRRFDDRLGHFGRPAPLLRRLAETGGSFRDR